MSAAMVKVLTSELSGKALDWVVTMIELTRKIAAGEHVKPWVADAIRSGEQADPYSSDPLWGSEIVEREGIATRRHRNGTWYAIAQRDLGDGQHANWAEFTWRDAPGPGNRRQRFTGSTHLTAAMRCHAATQLGAVVEVPTQLMKS